MKMKLDMSRGKPGSEQLDLSTGMLGITDYIDKYGTDCRNYGGIDGIPEMKELFADLMDARPDEILAGGNSSLSLMYECVLLYCLGLDKLKSDKLGTDRIRPDKNEGKIKFLCPAPGYDRHFTICEYLNIEMIPVSMTADGPNMDEVRRHVKDPLVVGIWCVPVFSNPQGIVYSDQVIKEMAALKPANRDFRILWDNAYGLHAFDGKPPNVANLLRECEKQNAYDMPLIFMSFSKISFGGAGVCAMAASPDNLDKMRKYLSIQTLGPDKLNQLRHVRFFKDARGVYAHMAKHAELLRPKVNAVLEELSAKLAGKGVGSWLVPKGGYFVPFDTLPGRAKRTVQLCAEAGLIMTPAGATYPYGKDPSDSNIRIAFSFPPIEQLKPAMEIFCTAVEKAAKER